MLNPHPLERKPIASTEPQPSRGLYSRRAHPPHQPELLPSAAQIREELAADVYARQIDAQRAAISDVLDGRDDRLLVVVGPCSVDEPRAALEYAGFLLEMEQQCPPLLLCMRTYFEKPRTTVGWKGLLYDPRLDGSHDVAGGIRVARDLLLAVARLGVPTATELLDPTLFTYLEDLIAWAAVGARTTESQVHRQAVSALPLPVGFKNGTDGSFSVAIDAMKSAAAPHVYPAVSLAGQLELRRSSGNPDTHLILRGGSRGPNYGPTHIRAATDALEAENLGQRRLMVDCSHGNSNKDYRQQPGVAACVADQLRRGAPLGGVMLESYLVEGRQSLEPGRRRRYGQSVTDGCIGLKATREVLLRLADAAASRC